MKETPRPRLRDLLVDHIPCPGKEDNKNDYCCQVGKCRRRHHWQDGKQYDKDQKTAQADNHIKKSRIH